MTDSPAARATASSRWRPGRMRPRLARRGRPAASRAGRDRVRVPKREAAAHEGIDEVDLGTLEVHGAHRVDDDADAVGLDESVVLLASLGERQAVGNAGAPARSEQN